jgi:RNA polymerase sigma factor (sigma-70 family)
MEDAELLQRYLSDRSQAAFGRLVNQYVDLVYAAAYRQTNGDHHRAQEVTQMVFISLARKAAALVRHPALAAWLHRSTRLAAADLYRRDSRRTAHEAAAAAETTRVAVPEAEIEWSQLRPALDGAINLLPERDRAVIVLRFFAGRPYAELGRQLGLSENAARMRVDRALDKLRGRLGRLGITSTSAALAAVLSTEAVVAAPLGVAAAATTAGVAAGGSAAAGLLVFMSANKITCGALGILIAAGAGTVALQERANAQLAAGVAGLEAQTAGFAAAHRDNLTLNRSAGMLHDLESSNLSGAGVFARLQTLQQETAGLQKELAAAAARRRTEAGARGPVTGPVYDPAALDSPPTPVYQSMPQYPAELRRQGISGRVVVELVVDNQGNVRSATTASSSDPAFAQSAIDAVSQWTFDPGQKGGALVNSRVQIPIIYSLNSGGASNAPKPPPASPSSWFPGSRG